MTQRQQPEGIQAEVYAAFGLCFRFLSQAYLEPPDEKWLTRVKEDDMFSEWPLPGREQMAEGLRRMQAYFSDWSPADLDQLKEDFTRLFIGLESTLAPPYESVYIGRDQILFDQSTLVIRDVYARFGLEISNRGAEPEDHIGYELEFVSLLCQKTVDALNSEDRPGADTFQQAALEFTRNHLLNWIQPFTEKVIAAARTDYFRGVAHLTCGTAAMFDELIKAE
ncbi:MAG: molecular chaperone TorD family protein [Acidobacteria bacterium]|nr:molecular chaperone TorD family protein [Acidobacteriota bacterium]MBU4331045.1 molecular chaperone TorD family protein [Acidobacteriota bacterium]MCG2814527.1 molecular chaperone TorD family protein [Candidatus Aminicenantes bacterium]